MSATLALAPKTVAPSGGSKAIRKPVFVRQTTLAPEQYRVNFTQIDNAAIALVTSPEAAGVTTLMCKIYLRLTQAPCSLWAGNHSGELHFQGERRGETMLTAWEQLIEFLGVAGDTASKALKWLHEQGAIGYCARKNGAGIRIWLNRAVSSIGQRPTRAPAARALPAPRQNPPATAPLKNLPAAPAPSGQARTPALGAAFNRIIPEKLETDLDPRASATARSAATETPDAPGAGPAPQIVELFVALVADKLQDLDDKINALDQRQALTRQDAQRAVHEAAQQAAAHHARAQTELRRWLDEKGLPKAVRVALRETFDLLRREGCLTTESPQARALAAARVGAAPGEAASSGASDGVAERLRQIIQALRHNPRPNACAALAQDCARALDQLARAYANSPQPDPDSLEQTLSQWEKSFDEALPQLATPDELAAVGASVAARLRGYRQRMDAAVYAQTERNLTLKALRQRYAIPQLSLFSL